MHIAGSRRILAPLQRVHSALRDPHFLKTVLAGHAELGDETSDQSVAWKLEGGEAHFRLSADPSDATQLAYDADAEGDDEARLKHSIETFLDALQSKVAGPRETAADGPLLAVAHATQSGFPFRAMPNLIFGMPLIFWAGSAIFFFIFVFMFGAYL